MIFFQKPIDGDDEESQQRRIDRHRIDHVIFAF